LRDSDKFLVSINGLYCEAEHDAEKLRIKCLSSFVNHTSNTPCWAFGGEEEIDITGEKSYFEACTEVCPLMRLWKIYTVGF